MVGSMERRWSDGYEASRGWTGHQQSGGYVSFPDYEKYFPADECDVGQPAQSRGYAASHHAAAADARRRGLQT